MNINRRGFLLGSAAATVLAGCRTSKTGVRPLKSGEKRTIALIGCGRQGRGLLKEFYKVESVRVTAVCDCDRIRRTETARLVDAHYGSGACAAVADFRDVFSDPAVDAVCIATPDHWHAYMSVEAMKHGKDVYCEKPLTFSIDEAKKVIAAQEKYDRVFQTGSMQRSWDVFRTACMIVRNGFIGDVRYVDANYGIDGQKLGGPSHPVRFFDIPENAAAEGAPNPDVDWDMWLGPAKWRPYSDKLAPRGLHNFFPMFWRFDDDLGSGYNGDWGAHHLDIAQWGLGMDKSGPFRIIRSDEPHSTNLFHGGRRQYGMKMLFKTSTGTAELYHGPFGHFSPRGTWGTVFYGTDGVVAVNRGKIAVWKGTGPVKPDLAIRQAIEKVSFMREKIVASSVGQDYGDAATVKKDAILERTLRTLNERFDLAHAPVQLYTSANQVRNFCECIETRQPTISPAEVGGRSATLCLLCNMSYQYDTGFDWDPVKMEIVGSNPMGLSTCRPAYRKGWEIVV